MEKIHPVFLPNKGQVLDVPEEFLIDSLSPYSRNMEYDRERLASRLGLGEFDTTVLSGNVQETFRFLLASGSSFTMFFTPKDVYHYDFTNSRYVILTPTYTTGTIEIAGGSLDTVTGTGTTWSSNLKAGDYIKIGAGDIHTGSTWYEIQSVDSNTQLTLTSNAVETSAGSNYVARKIFTGTAGTHYWDVTKFTDTNLGDIAVATNGVDTPIYWDGTGQVVSISGLVDTMKAKYVASYKDRIVWVWTVEGGANQPERVRISDVANVESYTTTLFEDLIDAGGELKGVIPFGDYVIIPKENHFYEGRFVGGDNVFDYDKTQPGPAGTKSNRSMVVYKQWLYYYGGDRKFHRWNRSTDQVISEENFPETMNFDPNLEGFIKAGHFPFKNQIRWFCPYTSTSYNDYIFVFDTKSETAQVWDCSQEQALLSMGFYLLTDDLYLDDSVWGEFYLDEQVGYFDDAQYISNAPIHIYGGYDGVVRLADNGADDDGLSFTRVARFKRFNFGLPHIHKRLSKQQWWLEQEASGNVALTFYVGDSSTPHATSFTISLQESGKNVVKKNVRVDLHGQNFRPELQATNYFSLLGFLNFYHPKRKTY